MNNAKSYTVAELVKNNIIEKPYDGNHGAIHPKGKDFINSGIPFIMASDVENAKIDLKNCKFISKKQADALRKGFAIEGDVLLTHKASIGRTAVVPPIDYPYIMLTPQVTYYRIKNKKVLNNYYLKYYFDSKPFQEVLGAMAGAGSTRAYLGIIGQQDLPVVIPDISIQQKIAAVLSALDAKIELNQRINVELESMAKTLYDYWFVQFNYPHPSSPKWDGTSVPFGGGAEGGGGWVGYKSAGGKMVWNEELKREIPLGWEVGTLLDIADYMNGLPCQKFRPTGKEFLRVIKIREMHEGFSENSELVRPDIPQKAIIENGDVLFSWSASLEVQIWSGGKGALNQHIFKVTSDQYPKSFYYYQLINYLTHFKMMAENRKTTMGHITQEHLKQSRIVLPPVELTERLEKIIAPIFEKIMVNRRESQTLTEVRDWLLPMLMNGQVRVS